MLISQEVELIIHHYSNLKHYIDLGYDCKVHVPFIAKVKHLRRKEGVKVEAKCEKCGTIKWVSSYSRYMDNKENLYFSCSTKCSHDKVKAKNLINLGVEYALQSKVCQEKFKKTSKENWGTDYPMQNKIVQDKVGNTNERIRGVRNAFQCPIAKEKIRKKHIEVLGVPNPMQSEKIKAQLKLIWLENLGVDNPMKSKVVQLKAQEKNLKNLGVRYSTQSKIVQEKTKETNRRERGVDWTFQCPIVKENIRLTHQRERGVDHIFQCEKIKAQSRQTMLDTRGVENYAQSEEFKEHYRLYRKNKLINLGILEKNIVDINNPVKLYCEECKSEYNIEIHLLVQRLEKSKINPCLICHPYDSQSNIEIEFQIFIESVYPNIMKNTRKILADNKELDIYIPDLKIAFEFNGIYWHSEEFKPNDYHLKKTDECIEKGINLYHVYEDDWKDRKDIVKSEILRIFNLSNVIDINDCTIDLIEDVSDFIQSNSLYNYIETDFNIGLFSNNEIVSIICFNKIEEDIFELVYYVEKNYLNIIDGEDSLLDSFINLFNPKQIIKYVDKGWMTGSINRFKLEEIIDPDYKYVIKGERIDENLLSYDDRDLIGLEYFKIYDSGKMKYILEGS